MKPIHSLYAQAFEKISELVSDLESSSTPFAHRPIMFFDMSGQVCAQVVLYRDGTLAIVPDDAFPKMITPAAYYTQNSIRYLIEDFSRR